MKTLLFILGGLILMVLLFTVYLFWATVIFLSNGYRLNAYDLIVDNIARLVLSSGQETGPALELEVFRLALNQKFDQAVERYEQLVLENPESKLDNLRWNINILGNWQLGAGQFEEALQYYQVNARALPDWWVSFAGIGECYERMGKIPESVTEYEKAWQLNGKNEFVYNEHLRTLIEKFAKSDHCPNE